MDNLGQKNKINEKILKKMQQIIRCEKKKKNPAKSSTGKGSRHAHHPTR